MIALRTVHRVRRTTAAKSWLSCAAAVRPTHTTTPSCCDRIGHPGASSTLYPARMITARSSSGCNWSTFDADDATLRVCGDMLDLVDRLQCILHIGHSAGRSCLRR